MKFHNNKIGFSPIKLLYIKFIINRNKDFEFLYIVPPKQQEYIKIYD